jgi:hypothetical protein
VLQVSIRRVHPQHLNLLRDWLAQLDGPRRDEALATLTAEGVSYEAALLIETKDGPALLYVMEVDDPARARQVFLQSRHPVDAEHRRVLETCLGAEVAAEQLLDLRADGRG